jgi:hypothetical protein
MHDKNGLHYKNLHTFVDKNFSLNVGMSISDKKEFPKNLFWWCQLLKNLWRPRNRETSNTVARYHNTAQAQFGANHLYTANRTDGNPHGTNTST